MVAADTAVSGDRGPKAGEEEGVNGGSEQGNSYRCAARECFFFISPRGDNLVGPAGMRGRVRWASVRKT